MTQFMTAAEQVEHGRRVRGEPTYDELQAINADLLAALEAMQNHFGLLEDNIMLHEDARNASRMSRTAIAKAKGE